MSNDDNKIELPSRVGKKYKKPNTEGFERQDKKAPAHARAQKERKENLICTPQQEQFCQEYLVDFNIVGAHERAGYAAASRQTNAYHVFNHPAVQKRIRELLDARKNDNDVTIEKVKASFLRIAEKAESEGNYAAALRAYENLGKYLGMFTENTKQPDKPAPDEKSINGELARLLHSLGMVGGVKPEKETIN